MNTIRWNPEHPTVFVIGRDDNPPTPEDVEAFLEDLHASQAGGEGKWVEMVSHESVQVVARTPLSPNRCRLWAVGSPARPASPEDIEAFQRALEEAGPNAATVTTMRVALFEFPRIDGGFTVVTLPGGGLDTTPVGFVAATVKPKPVRRRPRHPGEGKARRG